MTGRYRRRGERGDYLSSILIRGGTRGQIPRPDVEMPLAIEDTPPLPPTVPFFQGVLPQRPPQPHRSQIGRQAMVVMNRFLQPPVTQIGRLIRTMQPAGSLPLTINGIETTLQFFYTQDGRIFVHNNITERDRLGMLSGYVTTDFINQFYHRLGKPIKNVEFIKAHYKTIKEVYYTIIVYLFYELPCNYYGENNIPPSLARNLPIDWGVHGVNDLIFHHLLLWLGMDPSNQDKVEFRKIIKKMRTPLFSAFMNCRYLYTGLTHFEAYILAKKDQNNIYYTLLDDNLGDVVYRVYKITPQGQRSYFNLEPNFSTNPGINVIEDSPTPFQRVKEMQMSRLLLPASSTQLIDIILDNMDQEICRELFLRDRAIPKRCYALLARLIADPIMRNAVIDLC